MSAYGRSGRGFGIMTAAILGVCAAGAPALAQEAEGTGATVGSGAPSEALPPPRSDHDPRPPAAKPDFQAPGLTKQAGVGGSVAYGRPGVLELGGSAGFGAASNYTRFELSPSIGIFLLDNFQMSLLGAFNHFRLGETRDMEGVSATELRAMIEPSYHLPFTDSIFAFAGVGAGMAYVTGHDAGFAWQPRIGANFLIGRSGILTPSASLTYSTVEALRTPAGTLLAVQTTYGMNIGYTVMW